MLKAAPAAPAQSANRRALSVTTSLNARGIYQTALRVQNVWWKPKGPGIHLYRGVLVQDDACGAGLSDDDPIFEKVYGNIVLRKELDLPRSLPERASLVFVAREKVDNAADLEFVVNGKVISVRPSRLAVPTARQYEGMYPVADGTPGFHPAYNPKLVISTAAPWKGWAWSRWHYVDIPAGYLKPGRNQILVRSRDGKRGWALMVADYANFYKGCAGPPKFPKTSAKSIDGGKTWHLNDLGTAGRLSGEYLLRIFLRSYRSNGLVLSSVMDLAGENSVSLKSLRTVRDVRVRINSLPGHSAARAGLVLEVRTGDSPAYNAGHWSAWSRPAADGKVENVRGRYLQWRVKFRSSGRQSPKLTGITIAAEAVPGASNFGKVKIVSERNFQLEDPPPGYTYENYNSAYLKKFRRTFKLDQVVAGAHSEWQRQLRLLYWAYLVPLKNVTPIFPWDPQGWIQQRYGPDGKMVMNSYSDQRRDKMCLFSNVTLMAALQSFGYAARHVNLASQGMSGHEICEVWSDKYGKWVFLDATQGFYLYNKKTKLPLSTLDMHNMLVDRLRRMETWQHPFIFSQGPFRNLQELPLAAGGVHPPYSPHGVLFAFNTSGYLRIIPRSDMFSRHSPTPVSEGAEVWSWDGYLNWTDQKVPPVEQFSHYTNRRKDFNWHLNQVHYVAQETSTPGLVSVSLSNNMPYLAHYLVRIDGKGWKQAEANPFRWKLHPGRNTLAVKGRNTAGVDGMTSRLVLDYQP